MKAKLLTDKSVPFCPYVLTAGTICSIVGDYDVNDRTVDLGIKVNGRELQFWAWQEEIEQMENEQ